MESVDFAGWINNIQSLAVGTSRRYLYALGESEQLLILHAMLKGMPDLHKIEVPQSLESTFLEIVADLAFKGIPAKKDLQLKRFKDLCLQLKDITPDALNSAKQQVLELMKKLYQKLIESSSFNIMHHTSMVKKFGENSKRRHLFRKKVSTEKDKFKTFADCYNLVVSDMERHGHSHIERLDSSKKYELFPWSDHNTNDAVTLSSKRLLVQLFMRFSRLKEEREIIYEEMRNYLAFYKMLLKSLRADIALLQTIYFPDPIKDMPSSTCNAESIEEGNIDQSRQRRYATAYTDQDIANGMQAVKQTGIWFCLKQIQRGVLLFKDLIHCAVDVPFDEEQIDNLAEIENETDEEGNDEISDESDDENSETFLCCQDT